MHSIKDATISAFNEQIQEHRNHAAEGGEVYMSLIQFSSEVEETFFNVPIEELDGNLDGEQYQPAGNTALLDAMGYTIKRLQRLDEEGDVAFLVIVLSDGAENCSKKYTNQNIKHLRAELESTGRWTFQYVGCDEVALDSAQSMGWKAWVFKPTVVGVNNLSDHLVRATGVYYQARSFGRTSVGNFMELTDDADKT